MRTIEATVVRGHRIASGACGDPRFPAGTIALQLPFFRRLVPKFDAYLGCPAFAGTINLAVGRAVTIDNPEICLNAIGWTPLFAPERFFLSQGMLNHRGGRYPVFLYMPDPATKPDHAQPPDRIELLAAPIAGLAYGDRVSLHYAAAALAIGPPLAKAKTMR